MFNDKRYFEVNREERFFCFLFAHALLVSRRCRTNLVELTRERFDVLLDPDALEVYLEVAALRDYWNDLGDPFGYTAETHCRRRKVIDSILTMRGVPTDVIDNETLFWTSGVGSKLWNPGHWKKEHLTEAGLDTLKPVRWAFNAKPDILLLSPTGALVLEAKVESGVGRDVESGYMQLEVQHLIVRLWSTLIPTFSGLPIRLSTVTLGRQGVDGLTWEDVLALIEGNEVDAFTKRCLQRLGHYGRTA